MRLKHNSALSVAFILNILRLDENNDVPSTDSSATQI
jgi:hypothetical protein